jgi:hypothetical protein
VSRRSAEKCFSSDPIYDGGLKLGSASPAAYGSIKNELPVDQGLQIPTVGALDTNPPSAETGLAAFRMEYICFHVLHSTPKHAFQTIRRNEEFGG